MNCVLVWNNFLAWYSINCFCTFHLHIWGILQSSKSKLIIRCIPFRYRSFSESDGAESEKVVEVLMINSNSGPGLLFPKVTVNIVLVDIISIHNIMLYFDDEISLRKEESNKLLPLAPFFYEYVPGFICLWIYSNWCSSLRMPDKQIRCDPAELLSNISNLCWILKVCLSWVNWEESLCNLFGFWVQTSKEKIFLCYFQTDFNIQWSMLTNLCDEPYVGLCNFYCMTYVFELGPRFIDYPSQD